jgi:YHS domain-containing protein
MSMGTAAFAEGPVVCPIMGSPIKADSPRLEYAGTSFAFCCAGCDGTFTKDPKAPLKKAEKGTTAIGEFLFDPISHSRIKADKAKGSVDYMGLRYYFESEANLTEFKRDSKKHSALPKKESLTCPVMGDAVASYSKASGYLDYQDVRYYFCCAGCEPAMKKDPAKYAGKNVTDIKVVTPKKG